jgi:starch-binding outer membrane protein, SusD/RagB family
MKLYNIFLLAGAALFTVSCGDKFLDAEPMTTKTDINYYKTPAEATEALVGCYDGLQLIYSDGVAMPIASDVLSDLCFGGTGASDGFGYQMMDEFDKNVSPGDMSMFEPNWKNYYKTIYRVNVLLSKLDQVSWGNQTALRNEIESEARFIRAYCYFDMVRMWEKVPLLTAPTSANVPQSEPDAIYTVIANDLKFAVENGNTKTYAQIATTEYGHANKWAAELLMARVFLYYTGYYGKTDLVGIVTRDQALAYTEDVIANSGHDLVDNFSELWPAAANYEAVQNGGTLADAVYAGETNKEVVFGIKYTYTSDYNGNTDGNHWLVMNGIRSKSYPKFGYGFGWGACTVVPEFYTYWDNTDARKRASIMAVVQEGNAAYDSKDVREYTGYFTKKYVPICDADGNQQAEAQGGVNFMLGQYQDFFVLRFADALLMAAELGSPNALEYVNRVRGRAKLTPVAAVNKDVIYTERLYEFAFEGLRYWDLLRYDNTLSYAAQKVTYTGPVKNGGVDATKTIDGANLVNTRGLFQIPYNQITLSNGVLKQNTGW